MLYSDTLSHGDLYDFANHVISKKLSMIEGVSQVQTFGAQRAVRIQFIPEQLAVYQIGVDELALALKAGTVNIPGGSLNGPSRTFSLEPQGQLRTGREYGELIVAYRGWIGGIVSVDGSHLSRLADAREAAYYLITLILQLIPYSITGGAGVNMGLAYLNPKRYTQGEKWIGIPAEAIRDVVRIYLVAAPLFLVASLWEFFAR